jgi:hypothetical protein
MESIYTASPRKIRGWGREGQGGVDGGRENKQRSWWVAREVTTRRQKKEREEGHGDQRAYITAITAFFSSSSEMGRLAASHVGQTTRSDTPFSLLSLRAHKDRVLYISTLVITNSSNTDINNSNSNNQS